MGIWRDLRVRKALAFIVLLALFLMIVVLPAYNRVSPELLGLPMFYWYQLLWLVIMSALLAAADTLMGGGRR